MARPNHAAVRGPVGTVTVSFDYMGSHIDLRISNVPDLRADEVLEDLLAIWQKYKESGHAAHAAIREVERLREVTES